MWHVPRGRGLTLGIQFFGTLFRGQSEFCVVIAPSYHSLVAVRLIEVPSVNCDSFHLANFVSLSPVRSCVARPNTGGRAQAVATRTV